MGREFTFKIEEIVEGSPERWSHGKRVDEVKATSGYCQMNRDNTEIEYFLIDEMKDIQNVKTPNTQKDETKNIIKKLINKIFE